MSRLKPKLVATGLSVAVGAGLGAAALALGGTAEPTRSPMVNAPPLKKTPPLTPDQNRRPLSPETKREISAWATRLADCLANDGLAVGQPQAGENEIVIRPNASVAKDPIALVTQMSGCTKGLGKPPAGASVVFERQTKAISLYRPKTCLLPKKAHQ